MKYDLSESISQRSSGEKDAENHRIKEIANELRRRCQLYEAESRNSQGNVTHFEAEQRIAELFAKDNHIWLPMDKAFNTIFPETFYYFIGFAGYDGRSVMPILRQDLIKQATPATSIEIDTYMSAIGFTKSINDGKYYNNSFIVWDVVPRNVLKDKEGDIYVIDAEISLNNSKSDININNKP